MMRHLGGGEVLHSHFLRLRGEGFELDMFESQALTESAGSHPLFDGIQRVTVTSLTGRPS